MTSRNNAAPFSSPLARALNMLEDIQAAGYTLAPLMPTAAMLSAAQTVSHLDPETIGLVYTAMLSAAGDETLPFHVTKQ